MANGKIKINLDNYLKEHKFSRSRLSREGGVRYETVLAYCRETVTRMDIDTLARLCGALGCRVEDIIEFVPQKK